MLLKLDPTSSNFRLVGAAQAKPDELEASAADWGMYSSFVEERVRCTESPCVRSIKTRNFPAAACPKTLVTA